MEIETIAAPPPADNAGGSVNETPKTETKPDNTGAQVDKAKETTAERKFRLKFGKTERDVDEKEMTMLAQKGWASDEKFKSAKQIERESKAMLDEADIDKLIEKKYGKNADEWAKERLKEKLRKAVMSPEEREEFDRKARLEDLKSQEEEYLNKQAQRKLEAQTQHFQEQYDKEFAAALEKHKLPKNKYVMGRAIKIAGEIVDNDMDPDWDLVVGEAKRQVQEEISELFTDDESGLGWVGEDRVRKLAKLLYGKVNAPSIAKVVKQIDANKEADKTPMDADAYWEKKREQWSK